MKAEEWRTVTLDDQYEVSSHGRVRRRGGNVLKPWTINVGYLTVALSRKSIIKKVTIHRLVCEAFHGAPGPKWVVNHKDGDKTNNAAWNLEWTTYSRNNKHAFAAGLKTPIDTSGEKNGRSKLTPEEVENIRVNPENLAPKEFARMYGVDASSIYRVRNGKRWSREPLNARERT